MATGANGTAGATGATGSAGATGATGATGSTGATGVALPANYLQTNNRTPFALTPGTSTNVTFTNVTAQSGSDITFTPPSTAITLAAGKTYQICTSSSATLSSNTGYSSQLLLNGTTVPGSFISTYNSTASGTEGNSLANCTMVTGPGTLNLKIDTIGPGTGPVTINLANVNVTELG